MATGMPFSRRPSLVMTQTCLLLVSGPFPQIFIHGEYISCGGSLVAGCCGAGAAGAAAGACFLGAGLGCCANAAGATKTKAVTLATANSAVRARPNDWPDAIR